jgi:glycogen debranching enzyme
MAPGFARSLTAGICLMAAAPGPAQRAPELAYQVTEGQNLNAFVRDGKVAAHLLLRSGTDPRILVAFPAGNSGVGLWFDRTATPVKWRLEGAPQPVTLADGQGRPLYGIRAVASLAAPRLAVKQAVLSNVRFLRDYQAVGKFPAEVAAPMRLESDRIAYARDRVDGEPGYRLELRVLEGRVDKGAIIAGANGRIRLEIVAASGDPPLTGLTLPELLNERAADDPAARNALHFLSYREKFLAGSWRFNTYFGRDTLMSVRLLMPALQSVAIEAGLGAVLARLDEAGEVAHEEGLSEFAILDRRRHGGSGDAPTLDYAMIDDDFMLAPVAAHYLLDRAPPEAARAFLARDIPSETKPGSAEHAGAALMRNLRFVLTQARPYAEVPGVARLIALKPGRTAGQWRDSSDGIGGGRYPYDVNAVFVPAALDAAARLFRAGLLDPYLTADDRAAFGRAGTMAELWRSRVPGLFRVSVPAARAAPMIRTYAAGFGVPAQPALAALGKGAITFHAIALDAAGMPVPILNSDEGFALLFGDPAPAELDTFVGAIMRPFPAGLMTDIGLLVANPVLADSAIQARFTPSAYHGTVVWSWQQALLAAGLERQLARSDLPIATRGRLGQAQARLWRAISATRALQSSELWSWAYEGGRYRMVPFGAGRQDVDESNAAQLWSTVYLAVRPPAATPRTGKR